MKLKTLFAALALVIIFQACGTKKKNPAAGETATQTNIEAEAQSDEMFAAPMVNFTTLENNPVFGGTDEDTWDKSIRERGFILLEDGVYKMWYSGYNGGESDPKFLGYATSEDGVKWTRYSDKPVFSEKWTEDMFVVKHGSSYYMFAEGKNDVAHLLISGDGIQWEEQGDLVILDAEGNPIPPPFGTPAVWIEDGNWYLFYERNDLGIWLATSDDQITWKNVQDEAVLEMGPELYDEGAVAANQIVKYEDKYYLYYHGSSNPDWADPNSYALWTSNVAVSSDLVNWTKYSGNPLVPGDHSSPILVPDGDKFRLYTMHDQVWLYSPE